MPHRTLPVPQTEHGYAIPDKHAQFLADNPFVLDLLDTLQQINNITIASGFTAATHRWKIEALSRIALQHWR